MAERSPSPPGAGWRGTAWAALGLGVIVAVPSLSYRSPQSGPDLVRLD